jgi:hypothetical protein
MTTPQMHIAERRSAALMGLIAASLAVFATLHLAGILGGGSKPFRSDDAGIAEAITGIVLAYGAVDLLRKPGRARVTALVATGFAIVSFIVGLSFTVRGGDTTDVAYHAIGLPLLLSTFALLWWKTKSQ